MKKRWILVIHSVLALCIGGSLYLLFRDNTYLHDWFGMDNPPWAEIEFFGASVLRYYLPDFLWAYSLCCGLRAIIGATDWHWASIVTMIVGIAWELAQYIGWATGTADVADGLLYVVAVAVTEILFRRKIKC